MLPSKSTNDAQVLALLPLLSVLPEEASSPSTGPVSSAGDDQLDFLTGE